MQRTTSTTDIGRKQAIKPDAKHEITCLIKNNGRVVTQLEERNNQHEADKAMHSASRYTDSNFLLD